jgi:hypothetical protein
VTHVEDGEPFTLAFGERAEEGLVAVGWLDRSAEYPRGAVPVEFVERLRELCRNGVNRTRGVHRCTLCDSGADGLAPWTTVPSASGGFMVGSAEIRVTTLSGVTYASPDMVIHYVEEHAYRPPDDYIEGVLRGL